jgi:hypothetical protein
MEIWKEVSVKINLSDFSVNDLTQELIKRGALFDMTDLVQYLENKDCDKDFIQTVKDYEKPPLTILDLERWKAFAGVEK